jgi:GTPase SAR1 family protein
MALRARKPEAVSKRLKLFMYGPAGVGKTTAAIQFPNAYIIDCERGADQYDKQINESGGVVLRTNEMSEIIEEVKSLLTERHEYRTLVIDPITTAYNDLLDRCEKKVGSDFGKHYQAANKDMKRLANLIMALDMNVVITAHAKKEYAPGQAMQVLGQTFDGWKQLDYWFDLVIELGRKKGEKKRTGKVVKTRIETFPDQEVFDWSYDAIRQRYDSATLEREAAVVKLASEEQLVRLRELLDVVRVDDDWGAKCLKKANVEEWADMPADTMTKCIGFLEGRLGKNANPDRKPAKPNQVEQALAV